MVHILLKSGLENFEHNLASVWDVPNYCTVVWTFFGIALLWDWNENWPFPVLWPLLSFPNLLAFWMQHFNIMDLLPLLSWRSHQLKANEKHSPPVPPISLWSLSTMAVLPLSTCDPQPNIHQEKTGWWQWPTPSSPHCWTLWYTASGTKMYSWLLGKWLRRLG